jgi:excinuclease ABC subunit C
MARASLDEKARTLPTSPGVYLFRDRRGKVIYVGKAINLRARVRQYLAGADERFMVPFLVRAAHDVDCVVVDSEKEALLLENTLIKEHRPRYNTKLVDDSNFLHLRLDRRTPWPTYDLVRRIGSDKARYFGPFHSASRARATLAFVQRSFPLRTCTDAVLRSRRRPCLLHQMGRCAAPCVGLVDEPAYERIVEESTWFLEGKTGPLVARLKERMRTAADELRFEDAARVRDLIASIEATLERQKVVASDLADRDVWGLYREGSRGAVAILPVREGRMAEPRTFLVDDLVGDDGEALSSLVNAAYPHDDVPAQILLPTLPADADALSDVLTERSGRRVKVATPRRGDKVRLVELATENAKTRFLREHDADARLRAGLARLAELLDLPAPPTRIECFDNSNIGGAQPVASMTVLIDGKPNRAEYRRYRVKTVVGADDFATMKEILGRRVRRALDGRGAPLPDLLVVDGGRGQLASARAALAELGVTNQPIVGLSKPRTEHARGELDATDKIVRHDRKDPIRLSPHDPALRILQHVRDEAHKHAISYHRVVRNRETLVSVLDAVPGVGPTRRRALLQALGSARAVADADVDVLAAVDGIGPALAGRIVAALNPGAASVDDF